MDCSLCFSLSLDLSPISPHLPPVDATYIYVCNRLLPHLSRPVADQPSTWTALPPADCHHSSVLTSHARRTKGVPHASRSCLTLSSPPPLAFLDLCPGSCQPQGFPVQVSLPPYACLYHPHIRYPPLPASAGGPVPCWYRVVALLSFYPHPLCFRLALHVFRSVSWCLLKFDSCWVSFCAKT